VFTNAGFKAIARRATVAIKSVSGAIRFSVQSAVINGVIADHLTYLDRGALSDLIELVRRADRYNCPGIVIEMGCALGGSAIAITSAKSPARVFQIYDTFGLIPPPSSRDGKDVADRYQEIISGKSKGIAGETYYGYRSDLLSEVTKAFRRHGYPIEENSVQLIQGLFEETLAGDDPVALAHIDCDWYDSVTTCLERIAPRLVRGGTLVLDDYQHWSGCRRAVDDFFRNSRDDFVFRTRTRLHITKR
jgi:hypothetical protein